MSGVDEALECIGTAVWLVNGEESDAIVAPTVVSCERIQGHDFDVRDAEFDEVIEPGDRGIEGAFRRERADVEFVDDGAGERSLLKFLIVPVKSGLIVDTREAVDPVRLPLRAWVRIWLWVVVYEVAVVGAEAGGIDLNAPPALVVRAVHRDGAVVDLYGEGFGERRPNFKAVHLNQASSSWRSATGNRSKTVCIGMEPPFSRSLVSRFFQRPLGR